MAEGIVYLDVDDEITSAASRIRSSPGTKVVLVVPYGSRIATSRMNFRLLSREAPPPPGGGAARAAGVAPPPPRGGAPRDPPAPLARPGPPPRGAARGGGRPAGLRHRR